MSDTKTAGDRGGWWRGVPEEEALRRLLREAGPRPAIPSADLAAIVETARAEWWRRYGGGRRQRRRGGAAGWGERTADRPERRRLSRRWLPLAAAAVLAVVVGAAWWAARPGPRLAAPPPVASIEVLTGTVRLMPPGEEPLVLGTGGARQLLRVGTEIETAAPGGETQRAAGGADGVGRIALRMAGGASVRLDAGTRLRLASERQVELAHGAVYVDSGATAGTRRGMTVRTAAGRFEDIGTQFEVRTEGAGAGAVTRLRVREGRVALGRGEQPAVVATAGEQVVVRAGGRIDKSTIPLSGPEWSWVLAAAPRLDIEGVTVRTYLDWLARETGWRIGIADEATAAVVDSAELHGSIAHLDPIDTPAVVLASAGLGHRQSGGTLVVFTPEEEAQ